METEESSAGKGSAVWRYDSGEIRMGEAMWGWVGGRRFDSKDEMLQDLPVDRKPVEAFKSFVQNVERKNPETTKKSEGINDSKSG